MPTFEQMVKASEERIATLQFVLDNSNDETEKQNCRADIERLHGQIGYYQDAINKRELRKKEANNVNQ
jgi:hypothetical protein